MQVSGISHSCALDGLAAGFCRHPVAVYLKYSFAFIVILFSRRSALAFAVQLSAIFRLARMKIT